MSLPFVADEDVDRPIVDRLRKAQIVTDAVERHHKELAGSFSVISAGSIRIRPGSRADS